MSLSRIVIGPLAFLLAAGLGAQEPRRLAQPDSVSSDFALALAAAGGFAAEPQLLVGALPGWAEKLVTLPAGGRVLGSAFLGTTLVGIVMVPMRTDSLVVELRREHLSRGWKNPPPAPAFNFGGFRPAVLAPTAMTSTVRATLCNGDNLLTLTLGTPHSTYTTVAYRLTAAGVNSTCHPPDIPRSSAIRQLPAPTLYNPADAGMSAMDCSSAGVPGGMGGSGTTLRTALSPSALLDHYGRQLADSGWKANGTEPTTLGRIWTRPDSTGAPIEATLIITTPSRNPSCREVQLQLRSPAKP